MLALLLAAAVDVETLTRALLARTPPPPDWNEAAAASGLSLLGEPGPAAPAEQHAAYWASSASLVSEASLTRLAMLFEERPRAMLSMLDLLPVNDDTYRLMRLGQETMRRRGKLPPAQLRAVEQWVEKRSKYASPQVQEQVRDRLTPLDDALRRQLRGVVMDRNATRDQRTEALWKVLDRSDEAWVLSLFSDETLAAVVASELTRRDGDFWLPRVVPLLKDSATRHVAAVTLAAAFQDHSEQWVVSAATKRMAARALLPWIANRDWVRDLELYSARDRFLFGAGKLRLQETLPHYAKAAANEQSLPLLAGWASTGDPAGVAALRRRYQTLNETERSWYFDVLLASGAVSPDEMAAGFEEYVRYMAKYPRAEYDWSLTLPFGVSVGRQVAFRISNHRPAAERIVARHPALRARDAATASRLLRHVATWRFPSAYALMAKEIAAGRADAEAVGNVLECTDCAAAYQAATSPVLIVLGRDRERATRILDGDDVAAKRLLFAAARIARMPLPLDRVRIAASLDPTVGQAADAWLATIDTPDTRRILFDRHPGDAVISGWRPASRSLCRGGGDPHAIEEQLRAEVRSGSTREVFMMRTIDSTPCAIDRPPLIIRIEELDLAQAHALRTAFSRAGFETLPPLVSPQQDFPHFYRELLHLTRRGGRRLVVDSVWFYAGAPQHQLVHALEQLRPQKR